MLKIAIIGSGFGQYGLLPAFHSIKKCKVVAICGERRPQLIKYCKGIGLTNIYSDWRLLLKNEELDAIALAITPHAQYTIAKAAIKKGLHVFAEKPLAANLRQARELLALATKKKITHGIDFIFPEIAEWKKTKELVENKSFGKLKHLSVNWDFLSYDLKNKKITWKMKIKEGGGALSFYFSHGLYYLEYFAGKIISVKGPASKTRVDLLLKFQNNISGEAHVNCNNKSLHRHQLIFQCEKGVIILENNKGVVDNFSIRVFDEKGQRQIKIKKDRGLKNEDERVKIVKKLATRFINACQAKKQTTPSFREGAGVQELIEKIRAS